MPVETISALHGQPLAELGEVHFSDAYRSPLPSPGITVDDAALAFLGSSPGWAMALLRLRNALVAPFGLATDPMPGPAELPAPPLSPGHSIRLFTILHRSDDRIVLGTNDRHLDFRIVVAVDRSSSVETATLATYVHFHNTFGRTYFRIIRPFHAAIVKNALRRGVRALTPAP